MPNQFSDLFADLQRHVFERFLFLVVLMATAWIIVGNFVSGAPSNTAMFLWFATVCACAATYLLQQYSRAWAIYGFVTFTIAVIGLAATLSTSVAFLYLLSLLILPVRLLVKQVTAFIVSIGLSLLILVLPVVNIQWGERLLPLFLIWLTFAISSIVLDTLFDALNLMQEYQHYAVQQMEDARNSRGVLAQQAKALAEAKESLEYANHQLVYARQAADEARQLKAQFAANVSHELRTPINLIVGFAEMIVSAPRAYGTPLPAVYWPDMNTIYRNAKHLQSLINDVLDISQIEADQMALVKESINLKIVILEAVEMLRPQVTNKGLGFKVLLPDQLPELWLDRIRIRQVIINLIGNALRFTDSGTISIHSKISGDQVLIGVADTGIGIPREALEKVFEEFHQLDSSLARRYGGSGLGLTLSRRFVAMHGGHLWAESEGIPDQGSCFWFSLPLNERPVSTIVPRKVAAQPQGERCFIVLDDDPAVHRFFERYMAKHKPLLAADPQQARQLLKAQPTALIADTRFSESEELAEFSVAVPVIFCPMPSGRRVMQAIGAVDYLVKPVSYETLNHTLRQVAPGMQDVLIIDDDKEIVRLFSRMLQTMLDTHQVRKAYSGAEGLALMRARRPDVVVLDLLMPDLDGLTLLHHMRASPDLMGIPVIVVSARGASEAIASPGAGEMVIHKPAGFQPLELIRCIEAVINTLQPIVSIEA